MKRLLSFLLLFSSVTVLAQKVETRLINLETGKLNKSTYLADTSKWVNKLNGYRLLTPAEITKLNSVASGATANSTDAQLRDRSTHTGTQSFTTVSGIISTTQAGSGSPGSGKYVDGATGAWTALPAGSVAATGAQAIAGQDATSVITPSTLMQFGQSYYASKLTHWFQKLISSPGTAKILLVGDSTSDQAGNASPLPGYLSSYYTFAGDPLAGFLVNSTNFPNFGANGSSINNFNNNAPSGKGINDVIAAAPDLVVFSYGINDVRTNSMTKAQLKAQLITAINTMRAGLPNTDFVLRMPNTFQSTSPNGYILQGSYASIAEAAQAQSDILYYAYKELENYWPNVVLLNTQDLIFGRSVITNTNSGQMSDEIHPAYGAIIDELVKIIGFKQPFEPAKATAALSVSYTSPWSVYPRALENTAYYIPVLTGRFSSQTSTYFSVQGDSYAMANKLLQGDIVNFADQVFFRLGNVTNSTQGPTSLQIVPGVTIPTNSVTGGQVTIYRPIYYGASSATETYVKNRPGYPYIRRVGLYGTNNFMAISSILNDPSLPYTPNLTPSRLQISSSDLLVMDGVTTPLSLSGFTAAPNYANGQMSLTAAGSFSAYSGLNAFLISTRPFENYRTGKPLLDFTNTAAGTTGAQTINQPAGTVNIAASGTSVVVTNSLVTTTSIVLCVIRTNDSTAIIKNVVPGNGSFTITLNAATTAETSIGFVVFN